MKPESNKYDHKDGDQFLSRRQARRFALQVLFSNEFLDENVKEVAARIAETLHNDVDEFSLAIIQKTSTGKNELDQLIIEGLTDKNIERVSTLEKILIRMALCELLEFPEIPIEVTLNEAVDLSKEFISLKSSRFINGVLDSLVKKLEQQNKIYKNLAARLPAQNPKKRKSPKDVEL